MHDTHMQIDLSRVHQKGIDAGDGDGYSTGRDMCAHPAAEDTDVCVLRVCRNVNLLYYASTSTTQALSRADIRKSCLIPPDRVFP